MSEPKPNFWGSCAYRLNSWWRKSEFRLNRSYGGFLQSLLHVEGYSVSTALLLYPLLFIIVNGPTPPRGFSISATIILLVSFLVAYGGCSFFTQSRPISGFPKKRRLLLFETTLIIVVSIIVWFMSDSDAREWSGELYRHQLILWILGMVLYTAILPLLLAQFLVGGYRDKYFLRQVEPKYRPWSLLLNCVELFEANKDKEVSIGQFLRSLIVTPVNYPLQLLFPVAVIVLIVPKDYMNYAAILTLLINIVVLAFAGAHQRLNQMLRLTRRGFFLGAPLILSLGVILLAVGRYVEFSYVSIILDSTKSHVILAFLVSAYVIIWFYEVWIGHALCEKLLTLFVDEDVPTKSRLSYDYNRASGSGVTTLNENQFLQVHGGRFVVVGRYYDKKKSTTKECFESYEKVRFFESIIRKAFPEMSEKEVEENYGLSDLRQRIQFYYVFLDFVLLVGIALTAYLVYGRQPDIAETIVDNRGLINSEQPDSASLHRVSLHKTIFDNGNELSGNDRAQRRNVVLVASSGGGTRAALYSASVFQGLSEINVLDDVVLFSGVSGGSAAIAHLQAHYDELVRKKCQSEWDRYIEVMSSPFIDDVIRGCVEERIAGPTRLGRLLVESFERRMVGFERARSFPLGSSSSGVIFNTALSASRKSDNGVWAPFDPQVSGGRLIFTNLAGRDIFPAKGYRDAPREYLNYVVLHDLKVPLTEAAALSANFPPVFPNSGIKVDNADEHWVTDGGAVDNRGIISLLYALRHAVRMEQARGDNSSKASLPAIYIIVAEASADQVDFHQDRGIGSKFGSSEKLASQLMVDLLHEIQEDYQQMGATDSVHLYNLTMPSVFRSRGGIGTHWMLPSYVTIYNPRAPDKQSAANVTLSGKEVSQLILGLHQKEQSDGPGHTESADLELVKHWIKQDSHQIVWKKIISNLGAH